MNRRFTNRELAEGLQINLAKWKRWSREFLPPDPESGRQCGYARKYTVEDAFSVYLAGDFLVGTLKFSIPEAKRIYNDLITWMKKKELLPLKHHSTLRRMEKEAEGPKIEEWEVHIKRGSSGFCYNARRYLKTELVYYRPIKGIKGIDGVERRIAQEYIEEEFLEKKPKGSDIPPITYIVPITDLINDFMSGVVNIWIRSTTTDQPTIGQKELFSKMKEEGIV
jgi:hypothetical protein